MERSVSIGLMAICLVVVLGCALTGGDSGFGGSDRPTINSVSPCKAPAGTTVTVSGSGFLAGGTPSVSIGGTSVGTVGVSADTITFTMPASASGSVTVANANGSAAFDSCYAGTPSPVAEIEPNDDTSGLNATDDQANHAGTGSLSSVADKDHFRIRCVPDAPFTIQIAPANLVPVVYIDGIGYAPDKAGKVRASGRGKPILLGLTGGSGAYSWTFTSP